MASRKNVPASTVRAWFTEAQPEGVPAPGSRGRLHPDTIAAFMKANPRLTYVTASDAEKPTITVPVTGLDKAGRKTTRQVTLTTEAARSALGHPSGKRGRFNKADLSDVLSQVEAEKVADQFV
jgi:hypothetical protein